MASFKPTRADVYGVRAILALCKLPNELILSILDYARYWTERQNERTDYKILMDEVYALDFSATYPYHVMSAFPASNHVGSEVPKIREVEFLVVSHGKLSTMKNCSTSATATDLPNIDQGWTTEGTQSTYESSSWFEVSILRPDNRPRSETRRRALNASVSQLGMDRRLYKDVCTAVCRAFPAGEMQLQRRPCSAVEPQRLHCIEMMDVKTTRQNGSNNAGPQSTKEGEYAWYLQSNQVARERSVFDGEMVPRHNIVWSGGPNSRWVGNEGSGMGKGFVESLQHGDWIVVWARAKVSRPANIY
jgi:hypothetical protein